VHRGLARQSAKYFLESLGLLDVTRELRDATGSLKWLRTNAPYWVKGAPDGLPVPPLRLVRSATGTSSLDWSFHSGRRAAESISAALERHHVEIDRLRSLLDFGCSYGRVIRHWSHLNAEVHGCDCNARSIRWCRRNLRFAAFAVNGLEPPLPYSNGRFDLVYALSVFTHLPQRLLVPWMAEMRRVLAPGGHLLLTTHGEAYLSELTPDEQRRFRAGEPVVRNESAAGTNRCGVYFSEACIRNRLAEGFHVVEFLPEGARGNPHQDLVLLRKLPSN
jgi:SAM-dependent methyltransferase